MEAICYSSPIFIKFCMRISYIAKVRYNILTNNKNLQVVCMEPSSSFIKTALKLKEFDIRGDVDSE